MEKIKAVIIGFAHMHVNEIALYISEQENSELIGVADVAPLVPELCAKRYTRGWNLQNIKDNYCSVVYDDYKKMLDELKPDIAYIMTENYKKPEIVEECAKRGINVSIEKPIAVNYEEALKIKASVDKYKIEAVVNWPVVWRPYILKMKNAIDSKIVGEPIKLQYINGHTGPLGKGAKHRGVTENAEEMTDEERSKTWWHMEKCGGGVFLDISCYGCLFSRWFMGEGATGVMAYGANLNTPFGDTADNFAGIIKFDGSKMTVFEGTWTTPRAVIPSGPVMLCTNGVIVCTGGAENSPDVKAYDIFGNEVEIPDITLGDEFKNMPCQYANHIVNKEDIFEPLKLDFNVEVMALIDATVKSSASGKEEKVQC